VRVSVPTEEEAAAIVVALEMLWPRPAVVDDSVERSEWRFSGRHWTYPTAWPPRGY
jgi:hypothetical protein